MRGDVASYYTLLAQPQERLRRCRYVTLLAHDIAIAYCVDAIERQDDCLPICSHAAVDADAARFYTTLMPRHAFAAAPRARLMLCAALRAFRRVIRHASFDDAYHISSRWSSYVYSSLLLPVVAEALLHCCLIFCAIDAARRRRYFTFDYAADIFMVCHKNNIFFR